MKRRRQLRVAVLRLGRDYDDKIKGRGKYAPRRAHRRRRRYQPVFEVVLLALLLVALLATGGEMQYK